MAQAIEILHSLDGAVSLIDSLSVIKEEKPVKIVPKETVGIGVIEASRETLYYQLKINQSGLVEKGGIIFPTGQNQVVMGQAIGQQVEELVEKDTDKKTIINEVEKLIRAFDPCMSCAAHFLRVKWQ